MSRILLDTSAYSAFKSGHVEIHDRIQVAREILLCPIVLGELESGFLKGSRRRENSRDLEAFSSSSRVRAVQIDEETAKRYALILQGLRKRGRPIPTNDIWIAACAMQHGAELVTTDRHFAQVDQIVVELFSRA